MIKYILFIVFIIFVFQTQIHANNGLFVGNITIKEIEKNIDRLKVEKQELDQKTKLLSKEYWDLVSFIRTDINREDFEYIKEIINTYLNKKNTLEEKLTQEINSLTDTQKTKKELLAEKLNFYNYLSRFIDRTKQEDFIEHVKFNLRTEKESKDMVEQILKNQNILNQRVEYLNWLIKNHKEELNLRLELSITQKVIERINQIEENPRYSSIDLQIKNNIYIDFINKLKTRINEIQKTNISQNYKNLRISIINNIIQEIEFKIINN